MVSFCVPGGGEWTTKNEKPANLRGYAQGGMVTGQIEPLALVILSLSPSLFKLPRSSIGYLSCNHPRLKHQFKITFSSTFAIKQKTKLTKLYCRHVEQRELPKNTLFLLKSPLKTEILQLFCSFVFDDRTALSTISLTILSSKNLEVEAMLNTAQFYALLSITHSVTLMSLGKGKSCDQF